MIELATFEPVPADPRQGEDEVTIEDAAQRCLGELNAKNLKLIISVDNRDPCQSIAPIFLQGHQQCSLHQARYHNWFALVDSDQ